MQLHWWQSENLEDFNQSSFNSSIQHTVIQWRGNLDVNAARWLEKKEIILEADIPPTTLQQCRKPKETEEAMASGSSLDASSSREQMEFV